MGDEMLRTYGGVTFYANNNEANTAMRIRTKLFEVLGPESANDPSKPWNYRRIWASDNDGYGQATTEMQTKMTPNQSRATLTLESADGTSRFAEHSSGGMYAYSSGYTGGVSVYSPGDNVNPIVVLSVFDKKLASGKAFPCEIQLWHNGKITITGFDSNGKFKQNVNLLDYIG